ncbi:hypothetical protein PoB_001741800 [Plakobranchus ocellatus]|uniref:Uncharacterized protein n=1 Tax=Plakobranchus ocellatus TaxID=259542 RepID=A0AAV3Z8E3_9GAST|nr:hypothetical protein PoB_001741800 [Plakobranchus ocellatus]
MVDLTSDFVDDAGIASGMEVGDDDGGGGSSDDTYDSRRDDVGGDEDGDSDSDGDDDCGGDRSVDTDGSHRVDEVDDDNGDGANDFVGHDGSVEIRDDGRIPLPRYAFMEGDGLINLLNTATLSISLEKLPSRRKDNVYFNVNNEDNIKKGGEKEKFHNFGMIGVLG